METPKFKPKFGAPKMEDMLVNTDYAFSYSPLDERSSETVKARNTTVTKREVQAIIALQLNSLRKQLRSCTWELYPELAPTGRLHYHGIIRVNDIIDFYYRDLYYLQQKGTYEIDTIGTPSKDKPKDVHQDIINWRNYCTKQSGIWVEYFDGYPASRIPYTSEKSINLQKNKKMLNEDMSNQWPSVEEWPKDHAD